MKAIIVAGGKGTRLGKKTLNTPKSLIKISGKTVLEYQIELLRKNGIREIIILINHLSAQIKKFCGNGEKWNVNITYFEESFPLGTAGGMREIRDTLKDDFIVLYGDLLLNVDLKRMIKQHRKNRNLKKNCIGTLIVHPNNHPYDSDLIEIDEKNQITNFFPKPHAEGFIYKNLVNAALYILSPEICDEIPEKTSSDFGKDIFPKIIKRKKHILFAYHSPEYLKDMGTAERLKQATCDVRSGAYERGSLAFRKPAIFLDRDGVINEEVDRLSNIHDFRLMKHAAEAIKKINESGYYAVAITNQPMVAKGFCSYTEAVEVNKKMETALGKFGAKIDRLAACPHLPKTGFPGENKKDKMNGSCRKPKTGMIRQAARDLNIDLEKSYFIGDSIVDALTAANAGVSFIGVKTGYGCKDQKNKNFLKNGSLTIKNDIYQAVRSILG
ncbi:MAG: HAD-IIIA family hydrolase [Candidatus Shapirobacteria bacterium]|jgi:histidinol-phosphate phosphatase family protein